MEKTPTSPLSATEQSLQASPRPEQEPELPALLNREDTTAEDGKSGKEGKGVMRTEIPDSDALDELSSPVKGAAAVVKPGLLVGESKSIVEGGEDSAIGEKGDDSTALEEERGGGSEEEKGKTIPCDEKAAEIQVALDTTASHPTAYPTVDAGDSATHLATSSTVPNPTLNASYPPNYPATSSTIPNPSLPEHLIAEPSSSHEPGTHTHLEEDEDVMETHFADAVAVMSSLQRGTQDSVLAEAVQPVENLLKKVNGEGDEKWSDEDKSVGEHGSELFDVAASSSVEHGEDTEEPAVPEAVTGKDVVVMADDAVEEPQPSVSENESSPSKAEAPEARPATTSSPTKAEETDDVDMSAADPPSTVARSIPDSDEEEDEELSDVMPQTKEVQKAFPIEISSSKPENPYAAVEEASQITKIHPPLPSTVPQPLNSSKIVITTTPNTSFKAPPSLAGTADPTSSPAASSPLTPKSPHTAVMTKSMVKKGDKAEKGQGKGSESSQNDVLMKELKAIKMVSPALVALLYVYSKEEIKMLTSPVLNPSTQHSPPLRNRRPKGQARRNHQVPHVLSPPLPLPSPSPIPPHYRTYANAD